MSLVVRRPPTLARDIPSPQLGMASWTSSLEMPPYCGGGVAVPSSDYLEFKARYVVLHGRIRVEAEAVDERVAQPVAGVVRQHLRRRRAIRKAGGARPPGELGNYTRS